MLRKIVTIALPVAAAVVVSTFFPAKPAQAYPAICDTTYRSCMASIDSYADAKACVVEFQACSGTSTPPPLYPARGAIKQN